VLDDLKAEGFEADFILTDVPYWQMDRVTKSKGQYKRVGEAQKQAKRSKLTAFNLAGTGSKERWLAEMKTIFAKARNLLRDKGYLAVFIGDMYNNGRYHPLSADLADVLSSVELTMKANLIWYDVSKSLHVYGYQYEYIPSMIHQNILVFRKQ
jgi:DNA modification methylase